MGKYMRKSKTKEEIVHLDVSHNNHTQLSLGVRTRAKTLALQRLQKSNSTSVNGNGGVNSADNGGGDGDDGGGCYLQLRSRRLEKPLLGSDVKRQKHPSGSVVVVVESEEKKEEIETKKNEIVKKNCGDEEDGVVEGSFGENLMEIDGKERTTRESTPCSLIKDSDNIQTPGSSTKPKNASGANGRVPNSAQSNIPTAREMNDFFSGSEEEQQRKFIEKYNFDPVNDKPLPGRYEWVKIDR